MRNPPAKIAFVLPNFFAGGAERVMIILANNLDRDLFQPVIIVFNDQGSLRSMVSDDVQVLPLGADRVRKGLWSFVRCIRKTRPDLIISTMFHLNMAVLLTKPFLRGAPVIVREAITPSYFFDHPGKRFFVTLGYSLIYPCANKILAPTRLVFEQMPKSLNAEKFSVVFNPVCVDIQNKQQLQRAQLANADQRLFVGAGRLVDQKGFDRLIDALKAWQARDDWRLVILGDGPDREKLEKMIKDAGFHQIALAGFQANPSLYYKVADAFVLPSRHEGLPNVALEALAAGTPVIASASAGGISEIAVEAPGSISIAGTMDEFLSCMDRARIITGERKSLLPQSFSLGKVVESYQSIFTDTLRKD